MSHRILLVDDEVDILEFLSYNLQRAGYEVHTAQNGVEGLEVARRVRPHLILLDRMMPVMDGVETCRRIREDEALKHTHIVFLSALGGEDDQLSGFDAGADDYLAKPLPVKLLVSRVQAILKRIGSSKQEAEAEAVTIDAARHTVLCRGEELQLPRKEFALLELLYSRAGQLITREEIYSRIWGQEVIVGDRTIDVHIRKLRQKIGEGHIQTVKGVGYMFEK
ncbi:MAG: response regulator transcription factor [Rikenellaceae bacterium]|nr:response regulator transcription factor [Rikenellaceae bacterium]